MPLVGLVVIFNLVHKMKALYIWSAFGLICYFNTGILKSLFEESRPFWLSDEIAPQKCRRDFGNPSGHCMTATFFWLTVYLNKYFEVGAARPKVRSIFCTAYIVKMGLTVAMCLFFIFLALSRVFLGEHSYNQVLFGSSLGITLALTMHFFLKPIVKRFPLWLRTVYGINKERGTFNVPSYIFLITLCAFIIAPIGLAYLVWVSTNAFILDPNEENRIRTHC